MVFPLFFAIDSSQFPLPAGEQQHIRESLHKGFYFSQLQRGLVDSVWFPHPVSEAAEHITLQLLEYYQYCLPAAGRYQLAAGIVTDKWIGIGQLPKRGTQVIVEIRSSSLL